VLEEYRDHVPSAGIGGIEIFVQNNAHDSSEIRREILLENGTRPAPRIKEAVDIIQFEEVDPKR